MDTAGNTTRRFYFRGSPKRSYGSVFSLAVSRFFEPLLGYQSQDSLSLIASGGFFFAVFPREAIAG